MIVLLSWLQNSLATTTFSLHDFTSLLQLTCSLTIVLQVVLQNFVDYVPCTIRSTTLFSLSLSLTLTVNPVTLNTCPAEVSLWLLARARDSLMELANFWSERHRDCVCVCNLVATVLCTWCDNFGWWHLSLSRVHRGQGTFTFFSASIHGMSMLCVLSCLVILLIELIRTLM